ncbi:CHAT domain-containing protein [Aquimarina longa]|uniref:CHAT domain-containing protein n=1 Tax=Aquimarina longa TaxID=1080221 RepID=UPI0007840283|nr:CHAT domain-containing protein [Aquimarina longa]
MNYQLLTFCYIISVFTQLCSAQTDIEFKEILKSKAETTLKENQLDSFLKIYSHKLSKEKLADCYHEYGKWYYIRWINNRHNELTKKAIEYTKKAAILKSESKDISHKSIAKTFSNLGYFYSIDNSLFQAIDTYDKALDYVSNTSKKISIYAELGDLYNQIGDYHKGLYCFNTSILLAKNDTLYKTGLIEGYFGQIEVYSLMGYKKNSNKIKNNIQKIDSVLSISSIHTSVLKRYRNRMYQIEGNRLLKINKHREATSFFQKVIQGLSDKDSVNLGKVYNSIGLSFLNSNNTNEALSYLQKAILYNPDFTPSYDNLGDLYIEQQEFIKGLQEYQKAINYSVSNYQEFRYDDLIIKEELEVAANKYYLLHHLIQKANGWVQYYHYDQDKNHLIQALKTFKLADQLVDIIRFESTEYKSKLFWREQGASLYMKAVETCYLLENPEQAYYFMEKNKALLLLEDITNEQAKENAELPIAIAKREFTLKKKIYLSKNKLNTIRNQSEDSIQSIKDQIYKNKQVYKQFVDSISHTYPKYATNKKKIAVLPYQLFTTKYISDKQVVLQYILNETQGYGLLTTKNKSIFFEIKEGNTLQDDILTLHKQSSRWFANQEQLMTYHKNANTIFKQLLPEQVYKHVKEKEVIIVPDYTLQQISFDALTTSSEPYSYFIKDSEIRYAYSMSYLDRNKQLVRTPKYSFIGFAPISFTAKELGELAYSREEVISISDVFNGNVLIEERATKSNFLDTINQYQVIHLSTHADIGNDIDPWIAFRDKKLSLNEIYATKNQSDMVVLSACKSSLGELKKGEGVMSLARGFFHSGAKSVVSSLWATNDKSSQKIMLDFYTAMDQGATKASALRNAKLNYINSHMGSELSPFYWGSLILIGDNMPISLSSNFSNWYLASLIGILVILLLIVYMWKKRKQ